MVVTMNKEGELYVAKILNSLIANYGRTGRNMVFIRHYITFDLSADTFGRIRDNGLLEEDVYCLYHNFNSSEIQGPVEPFMDFIKELYYNLYSDQMSIEEFVDECGVYEPVKKSFISYIKDGVIVRGETVIIPEIKFERLKFLESIIDILLFVSREHKLMIVLNRFHLAHLSTLYFIRNCIKRNKLGNVAFVMTFNDVYSTIDYETEEWNKLIALAEQENLVYDWSAPWDEISKTLSKGFVFEKDKIDEYLKMNSLLNESGFTGQSIYYLSIIYEGISINKYVISRVDRIKLMLLYMHAAVCENDFIDALKVAEMVKSIISDEKNLYLKYSFYYEMCLISIYQYGRNAQEDILKEFKKITDKINKPDYTFNYTLTDYLSKFYGFKELFLCDFSFPIDEKFLVEMEERGYYNHLAYFYMFGYENDASCYSNKINIEKDLKIFTKGQRIAERLGNMKLILESYKKCITICSTLGYYEPVEMLYNKCLDIIDEHYGIMNIIEIYNGLGYNMTVSENHQKADYYLNEALMHQCENKAEAVDIAETLYNMAINAFLCEDYVWADKFIVYCVKLLNAGAIFKLRICNISKVYGIIAVSNYYLGIDYSCDYYRNLLTRTVKQLINETDENKFAFWDDDMAFYFLMEALIAKSHGKYEKADAHFNRAWFHCGRSSGAKLILSYLLAKEQSDVLKKLGRNEQARELLIKTSEYLKVSNMKNKSKALESILKGEEPVLEKYDISLKKVSDKTIAEEIKRATTETLLAEKTKDLVFVSSWQDMLNKEGNLSDERIIRDAMSMLESNYGAEGELFIEVTEDGNDVLYKTEDIRVTERTTSEIIAYFNNIRHEILANRMEKSYDEYRYIVDAIDGVAISTIVGIPVIENGRVRFVLLVYTKVHDGRGGMEKIFTNSNMTIFKYAFRQLVDAILRLRDINEIEQMNIRLTSMNEMLSTLAEHDVLTSLYNRNGLNQIISKLNITYDFRNRKKSDNRVCIIYLDLDNFKYYNDTFGHATGDKILMEFANLCTRSVGSRGYGVRYGGDEFIILIPNCTEEDAVEVATYVESELGNDRFYKNIDIDRSELAYAKSIHKNLTCSIGIAFGSVMNEEEVYKTIKNADTALYKIKNTSKNGHEIYQEEE